MRVALQGLTVDHRRAMTSYAAFVGVAAGTVLMPGPDMLVVLRVALGSGARAGAWAAAGSAAGNLLWGAATVAGVTAMLAASPGAFTALKLGGAAYLAALGAQALRAARRGELVSESASSDGPLGAGAAFRRGLASDLANVKVGLFWTALVPQFLTSGAGLAPALLMVLTMAGLALAGLAGFALLAGRLRRLLARPRVSRAVNGTVGGLLVGLATKLATMAH
jgi:threonine/homoserine/homoserine lactone efflux protein